MRRAAAFFILYVLIYAGWGVLSPFLPAALADRGVEPEQIGLLLAAGMAARLLSMPIAGAIADRLSRPREVLAALLIAAAMSCLGYDLVPASMMLLLVVAITQHAASGPIGPLPDALAARALPMTPPRSGWSAVDYGHVRGMGALAFIAGSLIAGLAVTASASTTVVLWINAGLFALAAGAALHLPRPSSLTTDDGSRRRLGASWWSAGRVRALLAIPAFRGLLLVTGLISGSHAFYVGFATLHWQAAGLAPRTIGLLWAVAVGAEVAVFMLLGRVLLARLGPAGVAALAAAAGALRWGVMASTAWAPAMLLVQPLHGLTFAAQHLAAMAILARVVPGALIATAQSVYAALGVGLAGAVLTIASGGLYARFGAGGFWAMALLCAAALPASLSLRRRSGCLPRRASSRICD